MAFKTKNYIKLSSIILSFFIIVCSLPMFGFSVGATSVIAYGTTGDCTWRIDDDYKLTISGKGNMGYYSSQNNINNAPWGKSATLIKSVVICDGVMNIGGSAFFNCSGLANISLPNSITYIGNFAFYGCSELASIEIPNSVTSIGDDAFYGCSRLTSITIPDSVTSIGNYVFSECTNLIYKQYDNAYYLGNATNPFLVLVKPTSKNITSCEINENTMFIHNDAFFNCSGLASIKIPNSVISIKSGAFYNCSELTSIIIPNNLTSIDWGVFNGCSGLKSIIIPDSIKSIGNAAFDGCSGLTYMDIPNSVTSIGKSAFENCSGLIRVNIPNSINSIENDAFRGCKGLTSIEIPNSVANIGECAFAACKGLTNVSIGKGVTNIRWGAFNYCSELKDIYYLGTKEQWDKIINGGNNTYLTIATIHYCNVGGHAFDNSCDAMCNICGYERTAPHNYVNGMCTDCGTYDKFTVINGGTFSSGVKWYVNSNTSTLYIFGEGETDKYKTSASVPWYGELNAIKSVCVKSGVTKIGNYCFDCLSSLKTISFETKDIVFGYYVLPENTTATIYAIGGGTIESYADNNSITFKKNSNPQNPDAPVLLSKTANSITIKSTDGYEYSIDGENFQKSNVFEGLTLGTEYTFYQRIAENDEYLYSETSSAVKFKTKMKPSVPSKPTVLTSGGKSVTLSDGNNYLYSIDGINFTEKHVFTGLSENVVYSFYKKAKSTDEYIESESSLPTKVVFVSAPTVQLIGATKVQLTAVDGFEYSLDGIKWQESTLFTRLIPEETYTVYQRLKNTENITVVELGTDGTDVATSMYDSIDDISTPSEQLVFIVDSLLKDKKEMASDINGDGIVDLLDLVKLKKNLANNGNSPKSVPTNTAYTVLCQTTPWYDEN